MDALVAKFSKFGIKKIVPDLRGLLQTIDGFEKTNNLSWVLSTTLRKSHIEFNIQRSIKESCLNIQMIKVQSQMNCNCTCNPEGDKLNHRNKGVIKVDARNLVVAFSNNAYFVAIYLSKSIILGFVDRFSFYCTASGSWQPWEPDRHLCAATTEAVATILFGVG